jgi:hypothetical protein
MESLREIIKERDKESEVREGDKARHEKRARQEREKERHKDI